MARTDRFTIAKADIVGTFSSGPRVLHQRQVVELFHQNREFWRLAKTMSVTAFLETMQNRTDLTPIRFPFPRRDVTGYTWGSVHLLETLIGLVEESYYSHYTAVRIHGLTEQVPKTIYLSHERVRINDSKDAGERPEPYDQAAIDAAFSSQPRASKNELELSEEGVRVLLLDGADKGQTGVTEGAVNLGDKCPLQLRYTGLERTLIDIVVRPFYAGGVFEVAKVVENAKGRVSGNALAAMLKRLKFGYPYHQALGYYMERAGYTPSVVNLFQKQPMVRDFYLTHAMGKTTFVPRWRLHVPKGF